MWFKTAWLIVGCGLAIALPVYFSWHPYTPKAWIPFSLGIAGSTLMLCGAGMYALRKRIRVLKSLGTMKRWLDFHIAFCVLGPLLIVYHSGLAVKAPNSAIAFYAMLMVVASGVVGRYIYRHFQFTLSGERATLKEMNEETARMDHKILRYFSESQKVLQTIQTFFDVRERQKSGGLIRSLCAIIRLDGLERKLRRQIRRFLRSSQRTVAFVSVADQEAFKSLLLHRITLEKKIAALEATTKLFAYWHQFHVPLIWILAVSLTIHMAAVMIF